MQRSPWKPLKPTEKAVGVWKARWELAGGQVPQPDLRKLFCQVLFSYRTQCAGESFKNEKLKA